MTAATIPIPPAMTAIVLAIPPRLAGDSAIITPSNPAMMAMTAKNKPPMAPTMKLPMAAAMAMREATLKVALPEL